MTQTPTIWYIHGAYSTSRTFNWIKRELPDHDAVNIDYSTYIPVARILDQLVERAEASDETFDVIGHSLGGILAVALSQRTDRVRRVVTLSTPFGGSRLAAFMQFLAPGSLMEDIQPYSNLLTTVRSTPLTIPVTSVVTTGGTSPMMFERNDGVVTISSQMALDGPTYVEHDLSHFEVLLDNDVAKKITETLWT